MTRLSPTGDHSWLVTTFNAWFLPNLGYPFEWRDVPRPNPDKHEMTSQTILKIGATLVLLVSLMPALAGQTRDPATYFFHDSFNDLREEGEIVRQEGKVGVLVMFETDD